MAKRRKAHGQVVYSRLHTEEAAGAQGPGAPGAGARRGREFEPLLPVLVISFVLLVGLVVALGWRSQSELAAVSTQVQASGQTQAAKTRALLQLRNSLIELNAEANTRQEQLQRRDQGDIVNPFAARLGQARTAVRNAATNFTRLPLAREPQGRGFQQALERYLTTTEDVRGYNLEGFPRYRDLTAQLDQFIEQSLREQEDLARQRLVLESEAAERIGRLTFAAAALAVVIAVLAVWELQRRFRQLRASLVEARRERAFSSQMLEGMVSAVAALDAQARVRSANRAFFRLFPHAAVGASVHDDTTGAESARLLAAATAAPVAEATYHGRWQLAAHNEEAAGNGDAAPRDARDGARAYDVYSAPLTLEGEPGQILTLVDVTEAAEAESELRRKTALAAVGQAAAQVAHEIKNPLGSIRLGVAMLRDMTGNPEAHNTIDLVERGIAHLNKLTVDVTEFSRERELTLAETNVHEVLDASLELVADRLREKRTPVERHYTEESLAGLLDADQLRQVFVNLLANATDASPEDAPIRVTTERVTLRPAVAADGEPATLSTAGPAARVTITDQGPGMDARTRARLFEPFFTTKKRGTGLGLAIVKKIVEQHGGRITADSAPGAGTSFHVELPLNARP
ncbi:MAG TPA: ATP-binding protein [Pyrinomonadaceae bacterium]|jgi:signal transduction histidine kinase